MSLLIDKLAGEAGLAVPPHGVAHGEEGDLSCVRQALPTQRYRWRSVSFKLERYVSSFA